MLQVNGKMLTMERFKFVETITNITDKLKFNP